MDEPIVFSQEQTEFLEKAAWIFLTISAGFSQISVNVS